VDEVTAKHLSSFQLAGRTLLACRCNNSHSGNLSVRDGARVIITRTRSMLGQLEAHDLVVVDHEPTAEQRARASSELNVHLAIYAQSAHRAVAHGHALAAVAVGWITDRFAPIDVEGAYYFGSVPVIECHPATMHATTAKAVAGALAHAPLVILRGHGVFAGGATLEQAMQRITSINDSAELFIRAQQLGADLDALARKPYLDFSWLKS
jgi:L-fuculose-phosphate aldolase